MPTSFSKTFVRLRKEAGYETAYRFFNQNGGAAAFRCSFPNYLRIEKGTHLPKPERLPTLCTLLRLPLKTKDFRELIGAYLETWLGSRQLADWMLAPFSVLEGGEAPLDPARQALQKVVREQAQAISVKQYEAVMKSQASYWCYRVLTSSKDSYGAKDLAKLLELPAPAVAKALEELRACRIAVREKDGRYASPYAGAFLVFPDTSTIAPDLMARVFEYNQAMIKKRGRLIDLRYCGVRADVGRLAGFVPHFREAIRSVNAYSVSEKTDQSALVFVEGRVYKLFDF